MPGFACFWFIALINFATVFTVFFVKMPTEVIDFYRFGTLAQQDRVFAADGFASVEMLTLYVIASATAVWTWLSARHLGKKHRVFLIQLALGVISFFEVFGYHNIFSYLKLHRIAGIRVTGLDSTLDIVARALYSSGFSASYAVGLIMLALFAGLATLYKFRCHFIDHCPDFKKWIGFVFIWALISIISRFFSFGLLDNYGFYAIGVNLRVVAAIALCFASFELAFALNDQTQDSHTPLNSNQP